MQRHLVSIRDKMSILCTNISSMPNIAPIARGTACIHIEKWPAIEAFMPSMTSRAWAAITETMTLTAHDTTPSDKCFKVFVK
jgi:hypothetical protein